jgi:hypothetical protein
MGYGTESFVEDGYRLYNLLGERLPAQEKDPMLDTVAIEEGFITLTPHDVLRHFPRYLEAVRTRMERARLNPAADARRLEAEFLPLWEPCRKLLESREPVRNPAALAEFRWLLEEFRVSLFAQQLKTAQPVSAKRLAALWEHVEGSMFNREVSTGK